MRKISRQPLSESTLAFLEKRTRQVVAHDDPAAEASRLWDLQDNKTFREVRKRLRSMAGLQERCMYDEDSRGTDTEHFQPKSIYPEQAFTWENLLWACARCNRKKGARFPLDEDGKPLLLDPTVDDPFDHLDFAPSSGRYEARTAKGRVTAEVYDLNDQALRYGRSDAWVVLQACLIRYAQLRSDSDPEAAVYERAVRELRFLGVFVAFLKIAGSGGRGTIHPDCLKVLEKYPEIRTWV